MADDSENKHHKQLSDVSSPGKTPADSTARPLIVTNRPMVKDPTLKHDEEDDPEIARDSDKKPKEEKSTIESEAKPLSPTGENVKGTEEESSTTEPDDRPKDDDQINPRQADELKEATLTDAEKARQAELKKLIESGKYVVPIGNIKRNRRIRLGFVLLVLAVIGVSAAAYVLMK